MEGFEVATAKSGVGGIEAAKQFKPDLILLDFEMPGMNGLELMKFIKKDLILNKLPVVMMSGVGGESGDILSESVKNLGGHFLAKPFVYENLCRIISEVWRE